MRAPALALALLLIPLAAADTQQGESVGLNLGVASPGLWDIIWLSAPAGGLTLSLTWATSVFPFADYDLRLYVPGALNDNSLADSELHALSAAHPFAHHSEEITTTLYAGEWVVAVVPWQAQNERYTLHSSTGDLRPATTAIGFESG